MSDQQSHSRKAPRRRVGARSARLALAVASDHLVVARLRRGPAGLRVVEVLECTLAPPSRNGWPELEEALQELAAALRVDGGTVDVALLRRLAHAKVVPLPPVRRGELGALVRRNAHRHFAVRDEPLVADAARLPGPRAASLVPTLAACAPAAIVEAVARACAAAGFRVGRIVPGAVALAEAARTLHVARRGRVAVVASGASGTDLVLLEDGAPTRMQPLSASGGDGDATFERLAAALHDVETDGRAVSCVLVCGSGGEAEMLRRAIAADETYGPRLASAKEVEDLPAEAVVAFGAATAAASVPVLLPEAVVRERARVARRRTIALSVASAALIVLAAGLHLWGVRREIDAVQARRREIAAPVRDALEARTNVEGVRSRLEALAALERDAPGWTGEIAALARALPDSAHLRTLAVDSTGLRLAGIARSASAVVPALEASPRFERVSLAAPVRWEQGDAGERFDVAASIEKPAAGRPRTPATRSTEPPRPAGPAGSVEPRREASDAEPQAREGQR